MREVAKYTDLYHALEKRPAYFQIRELGIHPFHPA